MRLRTFGGLWIEGEPAPPPLGPRRMALLALVAAAGRRGVSRDRILGILWPDVEEEQARHTLSQTIYRLKRDTGSEWIVAGPKLRLDPGIKSDVGDLADVLAAGDHEAAADLYTGAFLDGFHLADAPEFERWVDDERVRLRAAVIKAAEQAATAADRRGSPADALRVWTRLTELDPLSARYAAGRMRALAASGDRAGALAHARHHEAIVLRELETGVDPAIRELVRELKVALAPGTGAVRAIQAGTPRPSETASSQAGPSAAPASAATAEVEPTRRRPLLRVAAFVLGLAVLGALGFAALRAGRARETPFLAVGTIRTPELGDSGGAGSVLRDMLATTLGGLDGVQVVANSRLVELTPPGLGDERDATADAARRVGATEIIEGELVSESGRPVLSLRRVDLATGVVRRGYVVRAADRYALVDSAAAILARDLNLPPPVRGVGDVRTSSAEAYLLYNEGLRAFYGFDASGAYRLMNSALARDSTFVMAAYYAWLIGEHNAPDDATRRRELERMQRLATRTIDRERLLIQATVASRSGPLPGAMAIAETLTVRYPSDPDGHLLLGEIRFQEGEFAGSVAALERAFAIDSAAGGSASPYCRPCLALARMTHTYLWWDSARAAERTIRRSIALRPDDPREWVGLVEPLLRQGRHAEAEAALKRSGTLAQVPGYGTPLLRRDLIRWGRYEELDQDLFGDLFAPAPVERSEARWLLELSLRDQGRIREARALALEHRIPGSTRRVRDLDPEPWLSATMLEALGRPDSAARLIHAIARRTLADTGLTMGVRARNASWYLTLAGTAYAAQGDTAAVRRLADSVERIGKGSTFGRDRRIHQYLRGLSHQLAGRHGEAVEELRAAIFSVTDGYTRINLAAARSLLALGRPTEAIALLQPAIRGGVDGSNTYTSRTELHEALAEAFEQAGRHDSAVAHYQAVERAWRHADPEFAERYRRAREAATRD